MLAVEIIVQGRVQGVGFRYFVLKTAHVLGVDGEVWNRRNGGVEAIAAHPDPAKVEEFLLALKDGPGRVDAIHSSPCSFPVKSGFRITDSR